MNGRTDGFTWGAPKPVRPSVWPYPLVERRTDTSQCQAWSRHGAGERSQALKICNGMSPIRCA